MKSFTVTALIMLINDQQSVRSCQPVWCLQSCVCLQSVRTAWRRGSAAAM